MPFEFEPLAITDVIAVRPKIFSDERGAFAEIYKKSAFAAAGIAEEFVQVNRSVSWQHVLRGLHYQLTPAAQGKLIRVVVGEVFDVAVDIRRTSLRYGQWVGKMLTAREGTMLYIPPGFAHGFCVTSEQAEVVYYCTAEYAPARERGIIWNDPDIGIVWPIADPFLAPRDAAFGQLAAAEY